MRVLILNHYFGNFTGSEINALQLCVALREAGHHADIGAFEIRGPLLKQAEAHGIQLHLLLPDKGPALEYDLIWAHHAPVLTHVIFRRELAPCRVLFSSLSPLTALESPPAYYQELEWLLAHSPYNVAALQALGLPEERIHYFPNFVPKAFFLRPRPAAQHGLRRIAVVSNHSPEEVAQMVTAARADGLHVDLIGTDRAIFIDETVLPDYDLVITIGKTVPYCFAQRVPVYCYDHFGGPGYIDANNHDLAQYGNFCGRSFYRKLTGDQLYADIQAGYAAATGPSLDFLHEKARSLFSLEPNLQALLTKLVAMPKTDLAALRDKHVVAGRLNDAYLECLRRALHFEAELKRRSLTKRLYRAWRALRSWNFMRKTSPA